MIQLVKNIIEIKDKNGNVASLLQEDTYVDNKKTFSKEEIQKDFIECFARHRIVTNEAPDANIRRLFEALCFVFGNKVEDLELKQEELKKAIVCSKKEI